MSEKRYPKLTAARLEALAEVAARGPGLFPPILGGELLSIIDELQRSRTALAPVQDAARKLHVRPNLEVLADGGELRVSIEAQHEIVVELIAAAFGTLGPGAP